MEKREDGKIVLNTPVGLNLELLFADKSIAFKPKAEFLIHQTNYFDKQGGYQINSTNHSSFFGIKKGDLALIIRRLVDAGVIKKVKNYSPGNTSNTYQMVQAFSIENAQKSFYGIEEITFLRKWVADDYIVKNPSDSKFVKETKSKKATIASQQKEINDLKALLFDVLGKLNPNLPTSLSIVNCGEVAAPDSSTSTELKLNEGQPGIQSPTIDVSVKADSLTNEEGVSMPLPVHETAASTDLSAADLEALDELLLVFDGNDTPDTKVEIQLLSMAETISTTDHCDVKEDEPVEQSDDLNTDVDTEGNIEKETYLNGNMTVDLDEDMLGIFYNDKIGCIINYDEIKPWCSRLPKSEKQRFYLYLMSTTGNSVKFPLNVHTKAEFTREESEAGVMFTYRTMMAA